MKKLSNDLKRILTGLAYQDAGDFLSIHEKMKVVGPVLEARQIPSVPPRKVVKKPLTQRIALISNGRGLGAPLDYAIDACSRHGGKIDLLIHDAAGAGNITALVDRIQEAGLDYRRIQLSINTADDIIDYISNHTSLIFLVAMPDDPPVKVLIEEVIPKRGRRIPVPLVLIEDQPSAISPKLSAA
ncbi:MAG: hypothetical protein KZQ90_09545 [Candidatus Thiodiazotropha sp. (ex Codakia rugifera)]|nr:hypothetical protein [Candidatus Thiodiazotropha sp. (ex Codakia rugifera)]